MSDLDCEIEFLDEDAEIIQQCFQSTEDNYLSAVTETSNIIVPGLSNNYKSGDIDSDATNASDLDDLLEPKLTNDVQLISEPKSSQIGQPKRVTRSQTVSQPQYDDLLQEIVPQPRNQSKTSKKSNNKKRTRHEDDTDYDPNLDPQEQRHFKKRKSQPSKNLQIMVKEKESKSSKLFANTIEEISSKKTIAREQQKSSSLPKMVTFAKKSKTEAKPVNIPIKLTSAEENLRHTLNEQLSSNNNDLQYRNKLNIKIPDYEDPLCLPVKMCARDSNDLRKFKSWNHLCLDHLRTADQLLKPDNGETKCSKRIIIFRNIRNKDTGKVETTIWNKTSVENERNEKKTEVFQSILPRYRDNTMMHYSLTSGTKHKPFTNTNTVILTREEDKDGEILVVYHPKETMSSVYKLEGRNNSLLNKEDVYRYSEEENKKMCLKETTNCRVCAPCYQASWRGARQYDKKINCPICSRTYVTIYNLISHLKTHPATEVRKHKSTLSKAFSKVMDYHYKCRICQLKLPSIKDLKEHLYTHKSKHKFLCQVGNHYTL